MGRLFANGRKHWQAGDIDWDADTILAALLDDTASPDQADEFFNDLSAAELSGNGYSQQTLTGKTITAIAADSWATTWAASTAYSVGDVVRPTTGNGHLYRCVVAGTSDGSEPTWSTVAGQTVSDNTVTWAEVGVAVVVLDADDPVFTASGGDLEPRYAVYLVSGTAGSADYLLAYEDFGSAQTVADGQTLTVQAANAGLYLFFVGA